MARGDSFQRSGFTLVELILSLSVATLLLGGIVSAMVIASHALPNRQTQARTMTADYPVLDQIGGELSAAAAFVQRSATTVEFTVADRDANGSPETIHYEWSGTPGDPLKRSYNGGTLATVAEDVREFGLTWSVRTVSQTQTTNVTTTNEVLLTSFTTWSGITVTSSFQSVSPTAWFGQYFQFTPLTNVSNPKLSRVRLKLAVGSVANTTYTVAIHRPSSAGSPLPQSSPIGTPVTMSNSSLTSSYNWVDFYFTDVPLGVTDSEFVIVAKGGASTAAKVFYLFGSAAPSNGAIAVWTTNSGSGWNPASKDYNKYDAPFEAYASYTTTTPQQTTVYRYFVTAARLVLRTGGDTATRLQTEVQVLSAPEVVSP